ncbi:MAG TPA: hypothetical protein VGK99_03175 [Acidobacteriota bacterium]
MLTPVDVYDKQPLHRKLDVSGIAEGAYFNNGADTRQLWVKVNNKVAFVVAKCFTAAARRVSTPNCWSRRLKTAKWSGRCKAEHWSFDMSDELYNSQGSQEPQPSFNQFAGGGARVYGHLLHSSQCEGADGAER